MEFSSFNIILSGQETFLAKEKVLEWFRLPNLNDIINAGVNFPKVCQLPESLKLSGS